MFSQRISLDRLISWLIFAASLLVFSPVLGLGFLNWDDQTNFLRNPHFKGWNAENWHWIFTSFHLGVWQPLSWLLLDLEWTAWGMEPSLYHLVSLLLHGINAVLVFFLTRRLFAFVPASSLEPRAPSKSPFTVYSLSLSSAFGALFYALHPLRVEAVAWLSCQPYLLSVFFALLSVITYLEAAKGNSQRRWRVASALFFALALMSKGIPITLPAALLAMDIYPLKRLPFDARDWGREKFRKVLLEKIPFFALGGAAAWIAVMGKSHGMRQWSEHGLVQRLAQMAYGAAFYLWKTLLPIHLSPLYPLPAHLDPFEARCLLSAAGVLGITVVLLLFRRKWPSALAAWLVFGVLAAPVLGFAQAGPQIAADRYTYLPGIVWGMMAAGGLGKVRGLKFEVRSLGMMGGAAVILLLAIVSWKGTAVWKSSETVWKRALEVGPPSVTAYNNLGHAFLEEGRNQEAIEQFQKLIRLEPNHPEAYNNLGWAWQGLGQTNQAIQFFEEAIQKNPNYASPYNNLGILLSSQKRNQEAIPFFRRAVELQPDNPENLCNLALTLIAEHQWAEAIQDLEAVLKLDALHPNALYALAWQRATHPDPRLRNGEEALRLARELCGLTQNENPQSLDALAAAYAELGMFDKAQSTALRALETARRLNQPALVSAILRRLALYQKHLPYRSG